MAILYILVNALLVSASNVLGGVASRRLPLTIVIAIAGPASAVVALALALSVPGELTTNGLAIGFVAGLLGGAGLPVAYRAFAIGPVGIAGAVIAVTGTALLTVFGLLTGDPFTLPRAAGLALCLVSIVMVTYRRPINGKLPSVRGPVLAVIAAVLFVGFVITMNVAPESGGFWPLLGARIGVSTVALVFLLRMLIRVGQRGVTVHFRTRYVRVPLLVGALDVLGNVFLVLALAAGDLILLAIMAPAAPVFTALIGRIFLRELLTRWQIGGLVLASAALVFASL